MQAKKKGFCLGCRRNMPWPGDPKGGDGATRLDPSCESTEFSISCSDALLHCHPSESQDLGMCVCPDSLNHHFRTCSFNVLALVRLFIAFRHLPLSVCPRVWNLGASGMTTFRVGDAVRHAGWSAVDDIVFTRNKWFFLGLAAEFKIPVLVIQLSLPRFACLSCYSLSSMVMASPAELAKTPYQTCSNPSNVCRYSRTQKPWVSAEDSVAYDDCISMLSLAAER